MIIISISDVLSLIGGLALFLYGMNAMGAALEKRAGNKLKVFLSNATSNPIKGFLLGLAVTLIIQSSSATTVMVVGFVNSGIMTLTQSIGVILGANLGTSVTAWILSLQAIDGNSLFILQLFKPSTFVPILAIIGVILFAFQKKPKKQDIGMIMLGFAILMFGMDMMSDSVAGLKDVPEFTRVLTLFSNPILGIIVGTVFTAIIQSSSASVGVLQALTVTGSVTYATAIPVIMGQNIGTCVSALISSIGTSKNARRAAIIHLSFNIIATIVIYPIFHIIHTIVDFSFMSASAGYIGIAVVHTLFKIIALLIIAPLSKVLEKISMLIVKEDDDNEETKLLDERFYTVPSVAIERSKIVACAMAQDAVKSVSDAINLLWDFSEEEADRIRQVENEVDSYEDKIGSYLVKLSNHSMTEYDSNEANKILHVINDLERISDHAVNIVQSAEEIFDKKLTFSEAARAELDVLLAAVQEILKLSYETLSEDNLDKSIMVEPLEQVIDRLCDKLKKNHIYRLRMKECTIDVGFVLSDILVNLERISDHCSNIAGCVFEIAHNELDTHEYLRSVRDGNEKFKEYYQQYKEKFAMPQAVRAE